MKTIHAVYERGVFRPLETVELPERTEEEFEPRPVAKVEDRNGGLDAIYAILGERYQSGEHDVAARHNESKAFTNDGHFRAAGLETLF
jgi:predicted DNA-binding antitoxin AbrB/MazE fold protein